MVKETGLVFVLLVVWVTIKYAWLLHVVLVLIIFSVVEIGKLSKTEVLDDLLIFFHGCKHWVASELVPHSLVDVFNLSEIDSLLFPDVEIGKPCAH